VRFGPGLLGLVVLAVALAGLASASVAFAATSAPVVSKVSAASGPTAGGKSVTITGKNFMSNGSNAVKKVLFGTKAATHIHVLSARKLTVKTPSHAAGTVQVRVVSKAGAMSAKVKASRYTYLPLPTITALSVTSGPITGGTSVTITGAHLAGATEVTFGGVAASFIVVNNTTVTATTPAYPNLLGVNTTVYAFVKTAAGTTAPTMNNAFTFTVPSSSSGAPTVTGVSPDEGPAGGGTPVTITGTGFTGAIAVDFADVAATSLVVVSDTQITCVAPPGAGTVDVTVTNAKGVSSDVQNDWFIYDSQ
jgi:hypothetical protein